ncbi:MAG: patatin-like protein [Alphaproteobacteria bacterium]|nr:MAG: patatin-like protein [Alphaproteobacteria bacterium]
MISLDWRVCRAEGNQGLREKELRIALVCFGGISLAVYMHGVTKEILKLVRASSALHAIADRSRRAKASFSDAADRNDPEYDTEDVYFQLLRDIGGSVEMRVVVDIIAGASAGGINGTMLARALSHDLPMGALRELWLKNADVAVLLAPDARAGAWSKWFLKPFLWAMGRTGSFRAITDMEVRQKLSLFVRSRWFKPPLDGRVMAGLMYDAVTSMGAETASASLLPSGQSLDLFVTLTDYYGYQQLVQIHDPPLIHERDHHHVLRFTYRRHSNGEVESDFGLDNAPALAFAARATSSFPGAFPPARIVEMNELVAQRRGSWPRRAEFIAKSFPNHLRAGIDPATVSFLDGSVLNNRPFQEAIAAIYGRPAFREVDRRLVYIDPHPTPALLPRQQASPGFFGTLRGALSDIPSSQPVIDELTRVLEFNDQVRRLRAIVDSARPQIDQLVSNVVTTTFDRPIASAQLRAWREQVNSHVARDAGFAYQAYVRLKLASVRAFGAELIVKLRGVPAQSPLWRVVTEIIDAWALAKGIVYERADSEALEFEVQTGAHLPAWVKYLLAFDVEYRARRMHFLIKGQNRLYQLIDQEHFAGLNPLVVDRLKREFYGRLDALRRRETAEYYSRDVRELAAKIFPAAPTGAEMKHLETYAARFVERHIGELDQLIAQLAAEIDLDASTHDLDDLLASLDPAEWHPQARREVLVNYLGFPFWDVLTFPLTRARELGELNEILIDRISPQDAHTIPGFGGTDSLKGIGLGHFAGFLSRAYCENDYLLGRLHALDRLVDIVCDAAGIDPKAGGIDVLALKKRGFAAILAAEESHLAHSQKLIAALRRSVGEI